MTLRIIRDIRFYELRPKDYSGQFDGTFGHVFNNTAEIKHIGERIARKLNELNFVSGIFDHIYIYFSPTLGDNEIKIQETEMDERLKSVHYGVKPSVFNSLSDSDKDKWAKEAVFKVLYSLFGNDSLKTKSISEVEELINKYNQEIEIFYKGKETNAYKLDLTYQIKPNGNQSRLLVTFLDKKDDTTLQGSINLNSFEDIYTLVDTIVVKDNKITFKPKKSTLATLLGEKFYKIPLTLDIEELKLKSH